MEERIDIIYENIKAKRLQIEQQNVSKANGIIKKLSKVPKLRIRTLEDRNRLLILDESEKVMGWIECRKPVWKIDGREWYYYEI